MSLNVQEQSDPTGLETLEQFADAPAFNRWLFDNLAPYCKGKILEIGSGIGNISRHLLELNRPVTLTDLRPEYCSILKKDFGKRENLQSVYQLDIAAPDFEKNNPELLHQYDTVLASNVVEHIENDSLAIRNCKKMLRSEGHLVILVPAYQWLYNLLDKELGHFRRYTAKTLTERMRSEGLEIIACKYFNGAAIAGWWFSGRVQKRKFVGSGQLKIYNKLVPVFRLVDGILLHKAGLSVIAVGKIP